MWVVLFVLGVPSMLSATILLLKRMPVKSTPMLVKLNVGVSWIAALSILLLVPLDIADTFYAYNNHGSYYPSPPGNNSCLNGTAGASPAPLLHWAGPEETAATRVSGAMAAMTGRESPALQSHLCRLLQVALALGQQVRRSTATQKILSVCWEVVYWYTFAAMMVILPFHQEYADSGAFTVWEKVKWSLRQNLLFILFACGCGAFGVFVLLAAHRLTFDSLTGFAIAASNAFGLCLVLLLLGYGLVELPRKIWQLASAGSHQKEAQLYHSIGLHAEATKASHKEVCRQISIVREVSKHFLRRDPLRKYMDIVESAIDLELEAEVLASNESYPGTACSYDFKLQDADLEFEYADEHQLGLLRRDVRKAQEDFAREQWRYLTLIRGGLSQVHKVQSNSPRELNASAYELENEGHFLLNGGSGGPTGPGGQPSCLSFSSQRFDGLRSAAAGAEGTYRRYLHPWVMRALSLLLYALSLCIVMSQLFIYEGLPLWLKRISPLKAIIGLMEPNLTLIQITCMGLLGYILSTCWFSMFRLKVFSIYIMVPRHTPPSCMLMNAMILCRLTAPIAFNFMIIAMPPAQDTLVDVRQTTFYAELGERMLDLSSLGNFLGMASLSFTTFAPFIMLPWLLVVLFRQQTKFCKLGRNKLAFSEEAGLEEEEQSQASVLGHKLLSEEHGNYTSGLKLGLALQRYFAENAKESRSLFSRFLR